VLIFDEPTTGLDVLVSRALLQTIAQLRENGKCIIFSTHIMREVEKLCDRVAIMSHGRILTAGKLDQLRSQHGEQDLEELFFRLIAPADDDGEPLEPTTHAASAAPPGADTWVAPRPDVPDGAPTPSSAHEGAES